MVSVPGFTFIRKNCDIRTSIPVIQVYARIILNNVDFVEQDGSFTLV
jgi:hypothetical protein